MNIIPAIDLYDGVCVRLKQGAFNQRVAYHRDPLACANRFFDQGATELHVVDLNGAEDGKSTQLPTLLDIKRRSTLIVQTGGGLRDKATINSYLMNGIDRVVIGSLAVKQPDVVKALIEQYTVDRFVLAFDINVHQEPFIAINGWQKQTSISLWEMLETYRDFKNLRILCTDIHRDGMLKGPNTALYQDCMQRFPQFHFQASGGVSQIDDLLALKKTGAASVIVGKALYENRFSIGDAFREVAGC